MSLTYCDDLAVVNLYNFRICCVIVNLYNCGLIKKYHDHFIFSNSRSISENKAIINVSWIFFSLLISFQTLHSYFIKGNVF